ncbi:MAG: hypothetical protein AB1502_00200 [Thermodesulfobacteriota bacterium]
METSWSIWSRFRVEELSTIPKREGVYQFRCVDREGVPMVIGRLKNKDPKGIIYIGSSVNLRIRLKGFWRTIENKDRSRHAAAWTYCSFGYSSLFPAKRLQFGYKATPIITTSEFDLLLAYRKKFMDLPPLNSNRPPYLGDWKARVKKVFGMPPLPA